MTQEIEDLRRYLKAVDEFALPKYKELPDVALYMEQVLQYINKALSTLTPEGERILTSFMVNNYVKARMIDEPFKKKYNKDQIGYLMAICLMKSTISMTDMALLMELDANVSSDKDRLYRFWSDLEMNILGRTATAALTRVDAIEQTYQSELNSNPDKAEENARNALGFLALRLAIQAQANKLVSDYILSLLRKNMHGEKEAEREEAKGSREIHHEARQSTKEARRAAKAKRKATRKAKKAKKKEDNE